MIKGCSSGYTSAFVDASNIISSLSAGKLISKLTDTVSLITYEFCIKVTDSTGLTFTVDNLSLEV